MPKVLNKRFERTPEGAVYVGRPSAWGNPYLINKMSSRADVVKMFRTYAEIRLGEEPSWLVPLRGKDLVCWCSPEPCHADILLQLANQ